ncbi:MAG: T9SS type A sorting domain-containing protein [Leeuwenhoekiella sp.]
MELKNYTKQFLSIAAVALFTLQVQAQTSIKLTGTINGIATGAEGLGPEVAFDGNIETSPEFGRPADKTRPWISMEFEEPQVITRVGFSLRVQETDANIDAFRTRLAGTQFFGTNELTVGDNEEKTPITFDGTLLYEVSFDEAFALNSREFGYGAVDVKKGFKYVVIVWDPAVNRWGNTGELELYGYSATLLSVEDVFASSLNVYPIPANTELTIKSNDFPVESVEIYNMLGKKVLNGDTFSNDILDVSGLSSGMYMLKVDSAESSSTKKILIK